MNIERPTEKAQVTLFMIVGIMILATFSLLIYFGFSVEREGAKEAILGNIQSQLDTKTIQLMTSDCLKKTLEDGIILIGERGGYLKKEDFSNEDNFHNMTLPRFTEEGVAYLIDMGDSVPPWYPCPYPTEEPIHCGYINNHALFPDLDKIKYGVHRGAMGASVMKQLELYIKDKMPECANFQILESQNSNIDIEKSVPKADIEFTATDVSVTLDFEIDINVLGREAEQQVSSAKASVPVRFASLYSAVFDLLRKDTTQLDFNMYEDTRRGNFQGNPLDIATIGGISITKGNVPEKQGDDLFILNDSLSIVKGRPYAFKFARGNRNPVLNFFPPSSREELENIKSRGLELVQIARFSKIDRPPNEEDLLKIVPTSIDPDEDRISYSFSQSDNPPFSKWPSETDVTRLDIFLQEADVGYHEIIVRAFDGLAEDYQKVRLFVERLLVILDKRYNNFYPEQDSPRIKKTYTSIEDPFWFSFDHTSMYKQQNPSINPRYTYTLTMGGKEIFKRESEYQPGSKYLTFKDMTFSTRVPEISDFNIDTIKKEYITKQASDGSNPFSESPRYLTNTSLHISSSGLAPQDITITFPIEVKRCIPYYTETYTYPYHQFKKVKNAEGEERPGPFTQYQWVESPFYASHDCCSDDSNQDYRLNTRGGYTYCFEMDYYTSRPKYPGNIYFPANLAKGLDTNGEVENYPNLNDLKVPSTWGTQMNDASNDIFYRSFHQSCNTDAVSGRGNVCGGKAKDLWLLDKECEDLESGELERCEGPSRYPPGKKEDGTVLGPSSPNRMAVYPSTYQGYIPVSAADVIVDDNMNSECYRYSGGESFEKNFGYTNANGEAATGICKYVDGTAYYCDGYGQCTKPANELGICTSVNDCKETTSTVTCTFTKTSTEESEHWIPGHFENGIIVEGKHQDGEFDLLATKKPDNTLEEGCEGVECNLVHYEDNNHFTKGIKDISGDINPEPECFGDDCVIAQWIAGDWREIEDDGITVYSLLNATAHEESSNIYPGCSNSKCVGAHWEDASWVDGHYEYSGGSISDTLSEQRSKTRVPTSCSGGSCTYSSWSNPCDEIRSQFNSGDTAITSCSCS